MQVAFLITMLTGGPVPCLPWVHIVRLVFQTREMGYETDDLLVEAHTESDPPRGEGGLMPVIV